MIHDEDGIPVLPPPLPEPRGWFWRSLGPEGYTLRRRRAAQEAPGLASVSAPTAADQMRRLRQRAYRRAMQRLAHRYASEYIELAKEEMARLLAEKEERERRGV